MSGSVEQRILRYLAALATDPAPVLDVSSAGPLARVTADGASVLEGLIAGPDAVDTRALERLVGLDRLQASERLLRLGWGWIGGKARFEGDDRRILLPIVSVPIEVELGGWRGKQHRLTPAGDVTASHLMSDPATRDRLLVDATLPDGSIRPSVSDWLIESASAMGLPVDLVQSMDDLAALRGQSVMTASPTAAVYISRDVADLGRGPTLERWARRLDSPVDTAFSRVYGLTPAANPSPPPPPVGARPVELPVDNAPSGPVADSIVVLDPDQEAAVEAARTEFVSVIAGPPGTGKSHTVAAVALDAVQRGQSVLIATRSHHAANVLIDFLRIAGGPAPIVFGDNQSRRDLAQEVRDRLQGRVRSAVRPTETALEDASRAFELRRGQAVEALEHERILADGDAVARALAEGSHVDLHALSERFEVAESSDTGWLTRWWTKRGLARDFTDEERVTLRRRVAAERMKWSGGLRFGPLFGELQAVDAEFRARTASELAGRFDHWPTGEVRVALTALSNALRAGRTKRRQLLGSLDMDAVFQASPLWVGTIADVEDILPSTAGLFDLVIVDEASQIEQTLVPPALLRSRRVVAVGDANQLSHVSFIADHAVDLELGSHELDRPDLAPLLDVRRNSFLDLAATTGRSTRLSTHYRCAPHLIDFSARRFYDGRLRSATNHPGRDRLDCIDVVRVTGTRTDAGNAVEATTAVELVQDLIDQRFDGSIGIVTPLRAQADRLEDLILDGLGPKEIERHDIAVGTVHGFQGAERDHMIISLVVDDDSPAGSMRFVENDNLFNVMITRARERVTVLTSLTEPKRGLVSAYLQHAELPSDPPTTRGVGGRWTRRVATYLRDQGLTVREGYPVGHETLDLVVGEGDDAVALECEVHPDGPDAHIRRRALLDSMGWVVGDAFESRWGHDLAEFAVRFQTGDLLAES